MRSIQGEIRFRLPRHMLTSKNTDDPDMLYEEKVEKVEMKETR